MAAVVAKVGVRRAQRLWVHLLAVEEASPEDLAWLVLLACWSVPAAVAGSSCHRSDSHNSVLQMGLYMWAGIQGWHMRKGKLVQRVRMLQPALMKCAAYEICRACLRIPRPAVCRLSNAAVEASLDAAGELLL